MTTLIIVRHGQSMANLEDLFAGYTDTPLSPLGEKQAGMTAEYILKNYKIDKIYASDLKRAYTTAKPVADALKLPINKNSDLREINGGLWEKVPFKNLALEYPEEYKTWCDDIGNSVCPEGESVKEVEERVRRVAEKIVSENNGKTVLIATHATVVKIFQLIAHDVPLSHLHSIPWVSNASVTEIEYKAGKYKMIKEGYHEHLSGFTSKLPDEI